MDWVGKKVELVERTLKQPYMFKDLMEQMGNLSGEMEPTIKEPNVNYKMERYDNWKEIFSGWA